MKKNVLSVRSSTSENSALPHQDCDLPAQPAKGVIYCRVSSKEQVDGTSLESQEIACQDYARTHGITVLQTFVERGESAKFAERTQLIELIDFCRNSKQGVQALLVWKLDRFARNVGDHFNIKATLLKYGVRVVSVTEPIDANPEGKLMETILAGFAQFDNDIRAARTVQGMRRKIQEGIFPWKAPFGYKSPARDSTKKTKPDEPDWPLFGLLQKAWKEFATGAYTKADIQRLMSAWGVETKNGVAITAQSIDHFFRNPFYAGVLLDPWSGEEVPGQHLPMVTPEDFGQVQAILARRTRSVPHTKERPEFPLRGVARCVVCRHYLTGGFSKGYSKRYAYYNCGNRKCDARPSYRTEVVHDEFGALLDAVTLKKEFLGVLQAWIAKAGQEARLAWEARRKRNELQLARLNSEMQGLIRMRAQSLITDREFGVIKGKIAGQQRALSNSASPMHDARHIQNQLAEIMLPLTKLKQSWRSVPSGFHRRFNHLVVPAGFVIGESQTAELGLLFSIVGTMDETNSHEVALTGKKLNCLYEAIQAFADFFRDMEGAKKAA